MNQKVIQRLVDSLTAIRMTFETASLKTNVELTSLM